MAEQEEHYEMEGEEYEDEQEMEFDPSQLTEEQLQQYLAMHHDQAQYEGEEGEEDEEEDQQEQEQGHTIQQDEPIESQQQLQFEKKQSKRGYESPSPGGEQVDIEEVYRKIKRNLLENLNKARKDKKLSPFNIELMPQLVAERYASYLLDSDHDPSEFKKLLDYYKYNEKGLGDVSLIYIQSKYEEETEVNLELMEEYFMEIGYLLLEVENDKKVLLSPEMNHISIGINSDDSQIIIVYIVSRRDLCIYKVEDGEGGVILVHGKMLDDSVGVYALQILPFIDMGKPPDKNENNKIGPEFIDFDKVTKNFIAKIPNMGGGCALDIRQYIDLYTRNTPESIPYRKQTRDKLNLKHLELRLRIPVIAYPDPRFAHEEVQARMSLEDEKLLQQHQVEQSIQHQEEINASQQDDLQGSDLEDEKSEPEQFVSKKFELPKEQQISNKDIREELEIAIAEAQRQHDEIYDHNVTLQQKIKQIRNKQEVYTDKNNEMTMNEHKYLNTLAHVHQIRLDLQQTQDKYNEMAGELQKKLDEKSKKCNEIRQAFMELKRQVARQATYSRTDKPIQEHRILEWEENEMQKNKVLEDLRLDTLRLKNTLAKNQKQLKKKEELAEGLHLIDFEQLKIENQTLNEKIEERTEDLHKLKNKNTKTVQILTHTREKLGFVKAKFQTQEESNGEKKKELDNLRDSLGKYKAQKDGLRNDNLRLKQQTGIVNRPELIQDYKSRKDRVCDLKDELLNAENKLRLMQQVIEKFDQQVKAKTQQQTNKQKVKLF